MSEPLLFWTVGGWIAVSVCLLVALTVLVYLPWSSKPRVRIDPTVLSDEHRRDVLIFHAIKSPTLSDPAKKGFAKNYQRMQ